MYDRVVLYFKSNDTKYIIRTIAGRNYYTSNINRIMVGNIISISIISIIVVDTCCC